MNESAGTVDPIGEALHFLRMNGIFYSRCEFTAPWGLALPPFEACMMFHVVTAGECRLEVDGADACVLRPGNLTLVPHGEGHRLLGAPGADTPGLFEIPREQVSERYEVIRRGGGGAAANMICGAVRFDHPAAQHLLRVLPRVINVDGWTSPEMEWIQSTLRFITAEAHELRTGGETVITRLADILVIQAIRSWLARDPAAQNGWLGAMRDPQIGRAIAAVHRDPTGDWTLASLGARAGMSRSAFAARFTLLVGEPAMHYVTRWKMSAALIWLREGDASHADIANRLGYESEAAFRRAFKRFAGQPPGAFRRQRPAARHD